MTEQRRDMARRGREWRKVAGAAWGPPNAPQFFGDLDIDAGSLLEYQRAVRDDSGFQLTITHLMGRAVAHALATEPGLCVRLARGRVYPGESVDVFFMVSLPGTGGLTGVKVEGADRKTAVEVGRELSARVAEADEGSDPAFGRAKAMLDRLHPRLRRQSFGSAMITPVGMWGVIRAYTPLASYYRVPVLVCVGAVTQRPVAVAGRVVVRPVLTLTATFDHRYVDGAQAARFAHAIQYYCANPTRFEPVPERLSVATIGQTCPRAKVPSDAALRLSADRLPRSRLKRTRRWD